MKKWVHLTMIITLVFLLSGCWDQRYFKEVKLALASGFDLAKDGKLITTASLPNISKSPQGPGVESIQIVTVKADTPRQSRVKLDRKISKTFDSSKMRVLLFGKKIAKGGIYPLLDIFYRDPTSALNMNLGVVDGRAEDAIRLPINGENKPSEYLSGILNSASRSTLIGKEETIQGIAGRMLDPGQDVLLPYLKVYKQRGIVDVVGLAIFNGDRYTGKNLTSDESTLYLLMNGYRGDVARLTEKVLKNQSNHFKSFLTLEVKNQKIKKKVHVDPNGRISADLSLKLSVRIIEYPKDKLNHTKTVVFLDKKLTKILTERAEKVVKKLQKADCDGFGIGRRLMAYYRPTWDEIDWNKTYPTIKIHSKVDVEILQHGIVY
ncbi:MAG TPA: Ger(x)C family spore germination protein [Bacillales bacterium]|nr:Ger(x)C family spore germination protein [Bacillales bacterium]